MLDLNKIFNKFAGKEIGPYSEKVAPNARGIRMVKDFLNDNHPVIKEMKKVADTCGLKLRVWFPGTMGTMDMRGDRVNAKVEKGADGKYRIGNEFYIG